MYLGVATVMIEITRRCNMTCKHCMRGEPQDVNIDLSYIDDVFNSINDIGNLVLTGGEPTLNLPAIRYALESAKSHNATVERFEVVTNGKEITQEFIDLWTEWVEYVGGSDKCILSLSSDTYHSEISSANRTLLESCAEFSILTLKTDSDEDDIVNTGRALENNVWTRDISSKDGKANLSQLRLVGYKLMYFGVVYITALGDIVFTSTCSYDTQEQLSTGKIFSSSTDTLVNLLLAPFNDFKVLSSQEQIELMGSDYDAWVEYSNSLRQYKELENVIKIA